MRFLCYAGKIKQSVTIFTIGMQSAMSILKLGEIYTEI
ncbi:hypothetical protein VCJ_002012 [Vibrio metoecus]|nr:hypothetical protein VCJ_002012 [Vibrio metoecus]